MNYSPWSGPALVAAVQDDIKRLAKFQSKAIFVDDESAEEKSGKYSAVAGRQYNGRLGKVEISQVEVFAALVTPQDKTWIDGELFFSASWFEKEAAHKR